MEGAWGPAIPKGCQAYPREPPDQKDNAETKRGLELVDQRGETEELPNTVWRK